MIYDRPTEGPGFPIQRWGLVSLDGSRESGGYAVRLFVRERADYSKITDGALVVLFTEDWQGGVAGKKGGNAENRDTILFVGYVEDGSISLNPYTNRLEFRAASVTEISKSLAGFSATLESGKTAFTWNQMVQMTPDKAVVHYLRWQSTILTIADFHPTGDLRPVQFSDFGRTSVYSAINDYYVSALVAPIVADRQGALWAEIDKSLLPTGSARGLDTILSLTRQDWRSEIDIQFEMNESVSYIEMGGIAYSGPTTGSSEPYIGGAPGDAPAYYGSVERVSGLVLSGQDDVNRLAGNALARSNSRYPEVLIPMAGDYRLIEIAPQARLGITLDSDDTYRQIVWNDKPFIPQSVNYTYSAEGQFLLMDVTTQEETHGPPGESVEIPVDPPFDGSVLPDYEITFPPILPPDPLPFPFPTEPPPATGNLIYIDSADFGLVRSRNILDATPVFEQVPLAGVTGSHFQFYLDPDDPQNVGYLVTRVDAGNVPASGPYLYRLDNLDSASPSPVLLLDATTYRTVTGGNFQAFIRDMSISSLAKNIIWTVGRSASLGNQLRVVVSTDFGATWQNRTPASIGDVNNENVEIFASEHREAAGYTYGNTAETLYVSYVSGLVWSVLYNASPGNIREVHFPFQGNSSDQILYIARSAAILYSGDGGATTLGVTPSFDGFSWGVANSSGVMLSKKMHTYHQNQLDVAMVLQQVGLSTRTGFFRSTTGAGGLLPRFVWDDVHMIQLERHKTNSEIMWASGAGPNYPLLVTQDGGSTWRNFKTEWENDIGLVGAGFAAAAVRHVWTV
jgi:hypothetical protein